MAIDLVVPRLGESISEAVVAKWLKKVGEATALDEPVVDLETDKVSVSLPSPVAGVLAEQRVPAGATVRVGEVIGMIAAGMGMMEPRPQPGPPPPPPPTAPLQYAAPPTVEPPAVAAAPPAAPPSLAAPTAAPVAPPSFAGRKPAQGRPLPPSMRRAIREGGNGQAAIAWPAAPAAAPTPAIAPAAPHPLEEVVPMTPLRRRIAERLVAAQHTAAVLTTFNEVDMTNVFELRARYQEQFVARHGVKLGLMSFFTRACLEALKEFPGLNAEVRESDIVYKKHYEFGIAVGSGRGLVVPVLRDVDQLSFADIEKGIAALAQKAKDNKLTLEELQGATFSITNGGIYGSLLSTPLLNLPNTAILGMHNIVKRPVVVGEQIAIRPMMYIALSYDHRVVDGREAVQSLIAIKQRVENPERMLFAV